jgi:predicted metalloprotease with PDZ domain
MKHRTRSASRAARIALVVIAAAGLAMPATGLPRNADAIRISIAPGVMKESVGQGIVDITITIPRVRSAADQPLLGGAARSLPQAGPARMIVRDALGEVQRGAGPADSGDSGYGGGGGPVWVPARAVRGDVTVRYRLQVANGADNSGIPPLGPRIDGRAFSAMGQSFLALPVADRPRPIVIHWDLSHMGAGATAASSYGDGDVVLPLGSPARLDQAIFMAGQLRREPLAIRKIGFQALWSGDPGFDLHPPMRWTNRLYDWMNRFFGPYQSPYHVFLRYNSRNPGGGVAAHDSFMVTYGTGVSGTNLEQIFGHEMTHTFTAFSMGIWFDEGNAVYYQRQLSWRAGMATTAEYLDDINKTAARYYTNAKINAPEDQLGPNFWKDSWLNTLGYDRGALYFAILNGKIRRASNGKRSIDDLMRDMVKRFRSGLTVNEATWLDLVRGEIGEDGLKVHRLMMAGGILIPESDDYGPCFERIVTPIRRYELGFTAKGLPGGGKIVTDLIAGSEADKAGLRDGDRVLLPIITSEGVRRDWTQRITVQVVRDGRSFSVTYLPRGQAIDAYQWRRRRDAPQDICT